MDLHSVSKRSYDSNSLEMEFQDLGRSEVLVSDVALEFGHSLEPAMFLAVSQFFSKRLEPAVFPAISQ